MDGGGGGGTWAAIFSDATTSSDAADAADAADGGAGNDTGASGNGNGGSGGSGTAGSAGGAGTATDSAHGAGGSGSSGGDGGDGGDGGAISPTTCDRRITYSVVPTYTPIRQIIMQISAYFKRDERSIYISVLEKITGPFSHTAPSYRIEGRGVRGTSMADDNATGCIVHS